MKSIFKAFATISMFSIISRFLSFIYKIFLSNQISTSELGVYSVAVSISMIFLTILTAGQPLIISRSTTESIIDKNYKKNYKVISSGLLLSIILSLIVVGFILFFKPVFKNIFTDDDSYIVLLTLIPFLISSSIYAPIKGYLWGKEDFFSVSIVELFEQIIKIISCIILFKLISNSHLPAGIAMSLSCVASTILGFVIYFKQKGKLSSPFPEFKSIITQTTPITLIRVAGSLLQPLISIVLPIRLITYGYSSDQAMSLLGIVMGMTFPIITIPTTLIGSLAMAISPKLTTLQKQNNSSTLKTQIMNSITFSMFCCFMFIPIFYTLGTPICQFLFNNSSAGWYLETFAWVIIPMGLSQITTSILNSLSQEKYVFFTYFASSIIIIVSIVFLPKYIGISALLVGLGLQNSLVALLNTLKINKLLQSSTSTLKTMLKFVFISALLGGINTCLYNLLINILSPVTGMIIISVFSTVSFAILCYSFNIYNFHVYRYNKKAKAVV